MFTDARATNFQEEKLSLLRSVYDLIQNRNLLSKIASLAEEDRLFHRRNFYIQLNMKLDVVASAASDLLPTVREIREKITELATREAHISR